ncbi:glutathione ABC transporter ATP-binding protein [Kineosporia sp. NBRC 101677]|uniref:ATP-binding cassette domain-containing protein n=1 Tax=Kineosporia sp. NBRC 101677 TaxID=3032197 RepID=UPI0024A10D1E|nr:ABC transporter ATP-binding protein [Kineosporia sp. NBRC 101677]GLY15498.1 glutathione ABC transporter ATP-binding protein [Kineosporia sp. NBRC 101677]
MGTALTVNGLSVRYPGRSTWAVEDVSFVIEPGRCLGLVGESGSGKSTIGLAVQGLLTDQRGATGITTAGQIEIGGTPLDPGVEAGWRGVRGHQVTTVFQDPMSSLDPTMTIGRLLGLVTGKADESRRWLEEVEIREPETVLRSFPHQLSGGMRQRVMIALALARRPTLLVADEPTTALDVSVQAQILKLLTREREQLGCGVLFVTHDLGVARSVCDEVAVMHSGKIVEYGRTKQVFEQPSVAYTQRLVASRLTLATDRERPVGLPEATVVASMSEALGQGEQGTSELTKSWSDGLLRWSRFGQNRTEDVAVASAVGVNSFALELAKVQKSFATGGFGRRTRKAVLHGVDLRVGPRESVALVGESGSGKSTILRIAAGLEQADSGDVVVDRRRGEGVQVIFQDAGASLTPWLTVRSLLLERLGNTRTGAGLDKAGRQEHVRLALERVALPEEVLDARPAQLSGGQRQRVAIARAVVVPPSLLLCDEPTSALDVSVACSVLNLLNLLRHDLGLPMLFVTHDLAAARVIADRVVVISQGRIVESVPSDDLGTAITSDYGRRLLDAVLD